MADFLCIDGGTTNTRVTLVSNGSVIDAERYNIGSGKGRDDLLLKKTLKSGIEQIIERQGISIRSVEAVLVSGMITGGGGLCEIHHIAAPAGLKELHNAMMIRYIPEICDIPFNFIPGVKTVSETLENADIMRGEETELMGLNIDISDSMVLLPGSHSKCISVSENGKIDKFRTFLTGEMIYALSRATILSGTVDLTYPTDKDYLIKGYEYCKKYGINEALFKVRISDMLFDRTPAQRMGFFTGAVLYGEIKRITEFPQTRVIVAGKKELKDPAVYLLRRFSRKEVICVSDNAAADAPALGAVKIYEGRHYKG